MRSARDSGGGRRKQNQLAALDGLWKIARGAADPPQPIRHTAMLGDSEILSKKCSKSLSYLRALRVLCGESSYFSCSAAEGREWA